MPRLLRMAARTAVVAGTASAVSGRVHHRQNRRWAGQEEAAAEPEPSADDEPQPVPAQRSAPSTTDRLDQLKSLGELKAQGVLTEEEFAAQKAKILAG
jgi:Short C-terminal domain